LHFIEILQGEEIGLQVYRREVRAKHPLAEPPGKDPALSGDLGAFDVDLIRVDIEGKLVAWTAQQKGTNPHGQTPANTS
jgi:hypothetical protein